MKPIGKWGIFEIALNGKRDGNPCLDHEITGSLKEIPHNARGPLAGEFQPLAACKILDYPPGNLRFLQFAID